jgi:uncharacterized membrane protein YphA (DoxX/SURF4 family)
MMALKRILTADRVYWSLIVVLAALFFVSGFWEVTKNDATYPKTLLLGYPPYFITALGIAKIAGVMALLTPVWSKLKEWAFMGFTFDVVFALISNGVTASYADAGRAAVAFCALVLAYAWFLRRVAAGVSA